jgi:hypothetical protein
MEQRHYHGPERHKRKQRCDKHSSAGERIYAPRDPRPPSFRIRRHLHFSSRTIPPFLTALWLFVAYAAAYPPSITSMPPVTK